MYCSGVICFIKINNFMSRGGVRFIMADRFSWFEAELLTKGLVTYVYMTVFSCLRHKMHVKRCYKIVLIISKKGKQEAEKISNDSQILKRKF